MKQISSLFLQELLKAGLNNKTVTEIIGAHLKKEYIPDPIYQLLFEKLVEYYGLNKQLPTVGTLSQFIGDSEVNPVLNSLADIYIGDKGDQIVQELQEYVRRSRFLELTQSVADLYNSGKQDEAIKLMAEESKSINEFSLMGDIYETVFGNFLDRFADRLLKKNDPKFIPTNMPSFDHFSGGGVELGRSLLAIARSGVGKSFFLRQMSYNAAISGFDAIHFQGEGTKDEVYEYFDTMWSGLSLQTIKYSDVTDGEFDLISKKRQGYLAEAGEIHVVSFPQFNQANMAQCRRVIIELIKKIEKRGGKLGCVTFDYLEKFDPGNKIRYGGTDDQQRNRKMAVAEKITNIATEFQVAAITATQASNITKEDWDNEDFHITREHISNLKATIDAFSYCVTFNQTEDEDDNGILRIHEDKQRNYKSKSFERNYPIKMGREFGWFIDIPQTRELYWDDLKKQPIKK